MMLCYYIKQFDKIIERLNKLSHLKRKNLFKITTLLLFKFSFKLSIRLSTQNIDTLFCIDILILIEINIDKSYRCATLHIKYNLFFLYISIIFIEIFVN
jgi:hypothetical protein